MSKVAYFLQLPNSEIRKHLSDVSIREIENYQLGLLSQMRTHTSDHEKLDELWQLSEKASELMRLLKRNHS